MASFQQDVIRFINDMDLEHWLVALVVVVGVGFFCMRGFGSRSNY